MLWNNRVIRVVKQAAEALERRLREWFKRPHSGRSRSLEYASRLIAASLFFLALSTVAHAAVPQTVTYYYTDPQGNVLATTDEHGNILTQADRRPYGEQVMGTPQDGPGYTGHVEDLDSGLTYMQARYYDSTTGRFLSVDPEQRVGGNHLDFGRYTYVRNSPVGNSDPSGRCIWDGCVVEAAAVVLIAGAIAVESKILLDNARDHPAYVEPGVPLTIDGTIQQASSEPVVSDRPAGSDGKRGSTGGVTAGKPFPAEAPEVRKDKEGVPCAYCGVTTTNERGHPNSRERDHIDPASRGGNNTPENERDSCRTCNRQKGARNPDEWQPKDTNPTTEFHVIKLMFPPHMARDEVIETMHAQSVDGGFVLENYPFYVYGLSYQDTVSAEIEDDRWVFRSVIKRGGHSTYRILVDESNEDKFSVRWPQLQAIGCTYEQGGRKELRLYSVDVPPETDVSEAFALMQAGEDAGDWVFEEGHLYSEA